MSLMQRNKGKSGERQAAHYLTSLGYPARRGRQFKGTADSPDVVVEGVHLEVKWRATASLDNGLDQWCEEARAECGSKPWAVLWRGNRQPWRLTCEVLPGIVGTVVGDHNIRGVLARLSGFGST